MRAERKNQKKAAAMLTRTLSNGERASRALVDSTRNGSRHDRSYELTSHSSQMKRALFSLIGLATIVLTAGFPAGEQLELRNSKGQLVRPLAGPPAKATVFVFIRTDCPISNRYAPELRRLDQKYRARGVNFWLVYPGRRIPPAAIEAHLREYSYSFPALQDPEKRLVKLTGVHVTPEVAVYAGTGEQARLVYHGRIDNRFIDFGKARPSASKHELEETLDSILSGRPVAISATRAIGCFIADLE